MTDLQSFKANYNPQHNASQGGEDGIIEEIGRRLDWDEGWYVEFGAWDGLQFSNTLALRQRGWRGVLIEGNPEKARSLNENVTERITTINGLVSCEPEQSLDDLLARTDCPEDFEVLSIDVDGNDYWIWKSLQDFHPGLVVIEYNSNFLPAERFTVPYDPMRPMWAGGSHYGASAGAMLSVAKQKGYKLVAFTECLNLLFLRDDLMAPFNELAPERVERIQVHGGNPQGFVQV